MPSSVFARVGQVLVWNQKLINTISVTDLKFYCLVQNCNNAAEIFNTFGEVANINMANVTWTYIAWTDVTWTMVLGSL